MRRLHMCMAQAFMHSWNPAAASCVFTVFNRIVRLQAEADAFQREWVTYRQAQQHLALQTPLPKHWLPFVDANTHEVQYLNTQSGCLHSQHPNMTMLQPFLEQQWKQAHTSLESALGQRFADLDALQQRGLSTQAHVYQQLCELRLAPLM